MLVLKGVSNITKTISIIMATIIMLTASVNAEIDRIEISEKDGKLDITVIFNGKFRQHIDLYNNGELDESYMESWYMAL